MEREQQKQRNREKELHAHFQKMTSPSTGSSIPSPSSSYSLTSQPAGSPPANRLDNRQVCRTVFLQLLSRWFSVAFVFSFSLLRCPLAFFSSSPCESHFVFSSSLAFFCICMTILAVSGRGTVFKFDINHSPRTGKFLLLHSCLFLPFSLSCFGVFPCKVSPVFFRVHCLLLRQIFPCFHPLFSGYRLDA